MNSVINLLKELLNDDCDTMDSSDPQYSVCKSEKDDGTENTSKSSTNGYSMNAPEEIIKKLLFFDCDNEEICLRYIQLIFFAIVTSIIVVVMLMEQRKTCLPKCLGGHFAMIVPVNFLEERRDRLTVVSAFGVSFVQVLEMLIDSNEDMKHENPFVKALFRLVIVLMICMNCMPFFICFAANTYVSLILGLFYILFYLFLRILSGFLNIMYETKKCMVLDDVVGEVILIVFGTLMVAGYFKRINQKMICQTQAPHPYKFQKSYLVNLLTSKSRRTKCKQTKTTKISDAVGKLTRKFHSWWNKNIYYNTKGFRFSLSILISITIGSILVTYMIAKLLTFMVCINIACNQYFEDAWKEGELQNVTVPNMIQLLARKILKVNFDSTWTITLYDFIYDQFHIIFGSIYASFGVTYILFVLTILHMLKSYKENVLKLHKKDLPNNLLQLEKTSNVSIVVSAIQFTGYQVAYFLWGAFVQCMVLVVVFIAICEGLILPIKYGTWTLLESLANKILPIVMVVVIVKGTQRILVKFAFLQEYGHVLGLENRKGFYIMMYFMLFYNIFLGFFSCLMRVLKNIVFGIWFLPRLDRSIFPKTFEHMDTGFRSYTCLLKLEMLQSSIIVVSAVNIWLKNFSDTGQDTSKLSHVTIDDVTSSPSSKSDLKPSTSKEINYRARNRWGLFYTLMNNPVLVEDRRREITVNDANKPRKKKEILKECLTDVVLPLITFKSCLRC